MNSGPKQFNKGDAFTKQLRRNILHAERMAKHYDKLSILAKNRGETSDYGWEANEAWTEHRILRACLRSYLEFKGWEPRT